MLHRVIYGSIERFIGILTEHVNGNFPLWLSPNQIKVMTLNDDVADYGRKVRDKLFMEGFEVELNDKSESMGKKAREAQIQRFNYLVTVGEDEKKSGKIAVRGREDKEIVTMGLDEFVKKLKIEVSEKVL
jgi:threonyl-tRNA synthetase